MIAKSNQFRNPKYLRWVKTLPCAVCGASADDPHHIIGVGEGGMGMKASDLFTMPVCRVCHSGIHANPELWPDQWKWVAKTIERAVKEGVLCTK